MLFLLASIVITFAPALGATPDAAHKDVKWWEGFMKAEVIATLGITLSTAVTWVARDYISKNQEVGRNRFKAEIVACLQTTLQEASKERDAIISLKLSPLQTLIEKLDEDLRQGRITDTEVKKEIIEIRETLVDLTIRMRVVEGNFDSILGRLNAELSSVLTACTGDPVKVRLFMPNDET